MTGVRGGPLLSVRKCLCSHWPGHSLVSSHSLIWAARALNTWIGRRVTRMGMMTWRRAAPGHKGGGCHRWHYTGLPGSMRQGWKCDVLIFVCLGNLIPGLRWKILPWPSITFYDLYSIWGVNLRSRCKTDRSMSMSIYTSSVSIRPSITFRNHYLGWPSKAFHDLLPCPCLTLPDHLGWLKAQASKPRLSDFWS